MFFDKFYKTVPLKGTVFLMLRGKYKIKKLGDKDEYGFLERKVEKALKK